MLKTLKDFNVKGKRVLLRCDLNVPLDDQGNILDDFRIKKSLPTIQYLLKNNAKIIIMSHLGDPKGQAVPNLKMDKIQEALVGYLGKPVTKTPDAIGFDVEQYTYGLVPGDVLLLENLRFHIEETNNDREFARFLSRYGDIYINDAFGACHRSHASIVGVAEFLPSGMGLLLQEELENLQKLTKNPKKPMLAIVGGAKVETKAGVIDKLSETADYILVSGLIKKEIDEKGMVFKHPEKIVGPVDAVQFDGKEPDIGPNTIKLFKSKIKKAKTIFWNGPLGQIEKEEFSKGTFEIAQAIAKKWFCFSAVGGGETIEFLDKVGLAEKFDYVSTGGGAMLEYLSGNELPGLTALSKEQK
jgi:3-phosphoglycerate kinase